MPKRTREVAWARAARAVQPSMQGPSEPKAVPMPVTKWSISHRRSKLESRGRARAGRGGRGGAGAAGGGGGAAVEGAGRRPSGGGATDRGGENGGPRLQL